MAKRNQTIVSETVASTEIPEMSENQEAILNSISETVSEVMPVEDSEAYHEVMSHEGKTERFLSLYGINLDETGETVPDIVELQRRAELPDTDQEAMSFEQFQQMVRDNEITAEQFAVILGVDYENDESEPSNPTIGHNQPPIGIDPIAEEVKETLSHWKPQVTTSSEAREALIAAGTNVLSTQSKLETSLRARLALKIADYFFFNTEGLAKDGNKLLHVSKDMYKDILKNVSELFPKEDITPTFTATLGSAIETSILLMSGKAVRGFFVLPKGRIAVREQDTAFPEYPSENLKEGDIVVESVCIKSNIFAPRIPFRPPGGMLQWVTNDATDLVLLPSYVSKAHYASLWDKEGELRYDEKKPDLGNGKLTVFISGKDVAIETAAKLAKAKADRLAAEARNNASQAPQAGLAPVDDPKVTEGRAIGGEPAAAATEAVSEATLRQLMTGESVAKADMQKLKDAVASLTMQRDTLAREKAQYLAASQGSIFAYVPATLSMIRERGPQLPANITVGVLQNAREVILRSLLPRSNKPLDPAEIKALAEMVRQANRIIKETDDDKVIQTNADDVAIQTFEGLNIAA